MKLGFLQVYNEENWIGYAIEQAMNLCDNLLIVEGSQFTAFPDIPERSDDGTLDIISEKRKQYPKRIEVINSCRESQNYRQNQCNNFNLALSFCDIGDYFIVLDADDFYLGEWIEKANILMAENKFDVFFVYEYQFAWSFKWIIDRHENPCRPTIFKKTKSLAFIPTHQDRGAGNIKLFDEGINHYHYTWVKPRERILIRMRTSGMYGDLVSWFNNNWDSLMLEDGKTYDKWSGKKFIMRRYEGEHPSILDNHPWRHVEDIRKL